MIQIQEKSQNILVELVRFTSDFPIKILETRFQSPKFMTGSEKLTNKATAVTFT